MTFVASWAAQGVANARHASMLMQRNTANSSALGHAATLVPGTSQTRKVDISEMMALGPAVFVTLAERGRVVARYRRVGKDRKMMPRPCLPWVLALAFLAAPPAAADQVEDFYRGKQIKLYIRAAPGGNYDIYSRLLGRHIGRFIPGNPSVLPLNMPGGGGLVALNYVANVAPRDGTVLTMITQSFPMDQALGLDRNLKVDLRTLNWIGNMSETNEFFYTAKSSPTRTLADARARVTPVAATGAGSIMTELAAVYNNMLGTRFKVIYGYPSGPDMTLAMERGEVEGRSTSNPQVLGASKVVVARPIVTNAQVSPERVQALRRAFDAAMADPQLRAEGRRENLDIEARSGEELQGLIAQMLATRPAIRALVAQAIEIKSAEPAKGVKPGTE